jgi:hypothetical protein
LAFFANEVLWLVQPVSRALMHVVYWADGVILNANRAQVARYGLIVDAALVACMSYAIFCLPFCYKMLRTPIGGREHLAREELALSDGMRPGMRFQFRFIVRPNIPAFLYALFFALAIAWQDNAIPLRLQQASVPFFGFEYLKAASNDTVMLDQLGALGCGVSLVLGCMYFVLSMLRFEESADEQSVVE